jgi:hypothetical protein
MSSPLDIQQLAADVLASVDADIASTAKTASDVAAPSELRTDVGRALKLAAAQIRNLDDESVTPADLEGVIAGARTKIATLMGGAIGGMMGAPLGPMGMVGGAALGNMASNAMAGGGGGGGNAAPVGPQQASTGLGNVAPSAATPKMASELGNELRKMAADIRLHGERAEETRAVKAAHILNAAIGLEHLKSIKTR